MRMLSIKRHRGGRVAEAFASMGGYTKEALVSFETAALGQFTDNLQQKYRPALASATGSCVVVGREVVEGWWALRQPARNERIK